MSTLPEPLVEILLALDRIKAVANRTTAGQAFVVDELFRLMPLVARLNLTPVARDACPNHTAREWCGCPCHGGET